jgi:ubiquinone/menaquinone biosynthesis C-methylase UbiE
VGRDHPIFTRVYAGIAELGERTGLADVRERVLSAAHGRLLIVGLGPGHDLQHLPPTVTSVVAIEPSQSMRTASLSRVRSARERGVIVDVLSAPAEVIPLPDDSVDTALVAYVLCSVDDVASALREIRRVLRPGGQLLVLEHVREREGTWRWGLQSLLQPVWPRLAGGCHLDRDTLAEMQAAGFDVGDVEEIRLATLPPVARTLVGAARPTEDDPGVD